MKEMSKAVILAKQTVSAVHFEKDLLSQMNHPFICNIIYAFQDSDNVYLILELSNGGDLRYHLYRHVKFNEQQTILALEYLHSIGVIHKDIKPENILFDTEGYVKLTDFGIARIMSPNNSKDASGTPGYMAPEVLNSKQHGYAVDYWALGVIIYELMFEKRPYGGLYRKDYKEQLCNTFVQVKHGEQPEGWSTESVEIVNGLLQRKEELRLGYNDINKIKSHPWFSDINWEMLLNHELVAPFIPVSNEDFYDPNYLLSFEITEQLKQDIKVLQENILNPNLQKQFNGFYYDKNKVNRRHHQNRRSFEFKNINNKS